MENPKKCIALLDLTLLDSEASDSAITTLCERAHKYSVATVCVYPKAVPLAKKLLAQSAVGITTVVNFPAGQLDSKASLSEISAALLAGATEIDIVFPYETYIQGQTQQALTFIEACLAACGSVTTKIILESGQFPSEQLLFQACVDCLTLGADFIKTSTGKTTPGATQAAVKVMLQALAKVAPEKGLKVSGGVRSVEDAECYLGLAAAQFGPEWISARHFRFGASSLLDSLLA